MKIFLTDQDNKRDVFVPDRLQDQLQATRSFAILEKMMQIHKDCKQVGSRKHMATMTGFIAFQSL